MLKFHVVASVDSVHHWCQTLRSLTTFPFNLFLFSSHSFTSDGIWFLTRTLSFSWTSPLAPYSTFHISFSAVLPLTLLARGLLDVLGLSSSSPSLSVSDNWARSSLELWELPHFSSDADCSSLLLSSARQLLVLRRVLDRRISWSFSHSFLNRWTGPEIKTKLVDTLFPEARWCFWYFI